MKKCLKRLKNGLKQTGAVFCLFEFLENTANALARLVFKEGNCLENVNFERIRSKNVDFKKLVFLSRSNDLASAPSFMSEHTSRYPLLLRAPIVFL